jgi:hypothetical protein
MFDFFIKKNRKICPYCRIQIGKKHKIKFTCPCCKGEIFIRKEADKSQYITRADFESKQVEEKANAERNNYYRFFEQEVGGNFLQQREKEWLEEFKGKATYPDLIWSVSNELIQTYAEENLFREMSNLYLKMAFFQKKYGRDFFTYLQDCRKMQLNDLRSKCHYLTSKVRIIVVDRNCKTCMDLEGKVFTFEEALKFMPIPHKDCNYESGWCNCSWAAEFED